MPSFPITNAIYKQYTNCVTYSPRSEGCQGLHPIDIVTGPLNNFEENGYPKVLLDVFIELTGLEGGLVAEALLPLISNRMISFKSFYDKGAVLKILLVYYFENLRAYSFSRLIETPPKRSLIVHPNIFSLICYSNRSSGISNIHIFDF